MRVKLIFILLLFFAVTFSQTKAKVTHKILIDLAEVSSGTISKPLRKPVKIEDSLIVTSEAKTLTQEQLQLFVKSWNGASYQGSCKFKADYFIDLYFKDGSTRNFRINGSMKEKRDYCYDPQNEQIFKEIWNNALSK